MSEKGNTPKHLLIIRMGPRSYVAMLPFAVRELRRAYPEMRITIASGEELAPFFEGLGVEIIPLRSIFGGRGIASAIRATSFIRSIGVDLVADLNFVPYSMRVSLIAWLRGLKVRYLHKQKVARWFRMGYSPDDAVPMSHMILRYMDVFRRLGLEVADPAREPMFGSRPNPLEEKRGRWVGFAPFASSEFKSYPEPMRTELVGILASRYERVFIHSGDGEELRFAAAMASRFGNVTAVRETFDLGRELDLLANEDCVAVMDSVTMHMCSLVGTPVVSVWGATHPQFGCAGYCSDPEGVLQVDMKCRPCAAHTPTVCRQGDIRCMSSVTPDMIAEKVEQIMARNSR